MKTNLQRLDVVIAFIIFLACCLASFVGTNSEATETLFTMAN
ncbi:MAG: hypothetical protein AAGI23_19955 [Bacteroidota bacterium]